MRTVITARHCEISDELRDRAGQALERLAGLVDRPVDATVVFDVARQLAIAEIRLHGSRGDLVATGEDKDHRSALDRAIDKIRRQADKDAPAPRRRGGKDRESA
jgi:ribosomal subunit interface protein